MTEKFDFIQSYMDIDPDAERDVVEARRKAHEKVQAAVKTKDRVHELCKLAFQLDSSIELEWFEKPFRDTDPYFSLKKHKAEAARLASLLLRERSTWETSIGAISVVTASFCGRRHSGDGDVLTREANDALGRAALEYRELEGGNKVIAPRYKTLDPEITAYVGEMSADNAKKVLGAIVGSAQNAVTSLAETTESSLSSARADIARLAEELDMLWWHIGDWHELLESPRSGSALGLRILASAIELATFVRQAPGPYGAYGLLRKTIGADSKTTTTLREAIGGIAQDDAAKLSKSVLPSWAHLVPVHSALQAAAKLGNSWEADAGQAIADIVTVEISNFELGLQTYRERMLIECGGLDVMNAVTPVCEEPGCKVQVDGICLLGKDPVESCPNYPNDASINDELEIDLAEPKAAEPVPIWVSEILSLQRVLDLKRRRTLQTVALIGEPSVGKTTLLAGIYGAFCKGPFAGLSFAGSETLTAFARLQELALHSSERASPTVRRTSSQQGLGFYHLTLDRLTGGVVDLAIADRSGETYAAARKSTEVIATLKELSHADRVCFLLDGERFASIERRSSYIRQFRQMINALNDNGALARVRKIEILSTKLDITTKADQDSVEHLADYEASLVSSFKDKGLDIASYRICALPKRNKQLGFVGLEDLIRRWTVAAPFPDIAPQPIADATRQIDRLLAKL